VVVNSVNITFAIVATIVIADPVARIQGLVGAYVVSYITGCVLLGVGLVRRRPGALAGGPRAALTSALAAAAMAAALVGARWVWPDANGRIAMIVQTGVVIAVGATVYVGALLAFGSAELRELSSRRRS
jgi:peptidoglycan biosynthesis protein MviN/MurJ (putative lipid II flippase)